jgi:uncharacterized protein (TIGR03790 family)
MARALTLLPALWLLLAAAPAGALEPKDIVILVNKNVPASRQVADHYCAKRGVPKDNVVVLDLPPDEDISRRDYDKRLKISLRDALKDRRDKVKVLLSTYGVPLRVGRIESNEKEKAQLAKIQPELKKLRADDQRLQKAITDLEAKAKAEPKGEAAAALKERRRERDTLQLKIRVLDQRQGLLSHAQTEASVDSELMLLWWDDYNLYRWVVNPLYFQAPEKLREGKPPVLMVSRLDGPSPALAMKLVDSAIAVEKKGLSGKVYVDARGIKYNPKSDSSGGGYAGYDESLREMARLLEKDAKMTVVLDDKPGLFTSGSCPDAALYCGWYSLAKYIDCCRFVPGAVAYHIASAEAVSLRNAKAKYWCKNLLDNGVIATLGPVAEPYTIGFPKPAEFFGFLVTGRYTLVECYSRTLMLTSWMTVLVGDPLYNPFARAPRLKPEQVRPSPAGSRMFK